MGNARARKKVSNIGPTSQGNVQFDILLEAMVHQVDDEKAAQLRQLFSDMRVGLESWILNH